MTDRRSQMSMKMIFYCRFAYGYAPAYGSKDLVRCPAYPALIPRRALRNSGTHWATVMPRLLALDSRRGWRFVAPGCIFERGAETRSRFKAPHSRGRLCHTILSRLAEFDQQGLIMNKV